MVLPSSSSASQPLPIWAGAALMTHRTAGFSDRNQRSGPLRRLGWRRTRIARRVRDVDVRKLEIEGPSDPLGECLVRLRGRLFRGYVDPLDRIDGAILRGHEDADRIVVAAQAQRELARLRHRPGAPQEEVGDLLLLFPQRQVPDVDRQVAQVERVGVRGRASERRERVGLVDVEGRPGGARVACPAGLRPRARSPGPVRVPHRDRRGTRTSARRRRCSGSRSCWTGGAASASRPRRGPGARPASASLAARTGPPDPLARRTATATASPRSIRCAS